MRCAVTNRLPVGKANLGLGSVLLFVVFSSWRDVYFASAFQRFGFLDVAIISFSLCTLCFAAAISVTNPRGFAELLRYWRDVVWVNVTSAAGWLSYFYALKTLEPSIVQTFFAGIGPITVITLEGLGIHLARSVPIRPLEKLFHAGILLSLLLTSGVVLAGLSGMPSQSIAERGLGVGLAFMSGMSMSFKDLICKRMNERGVSPEKILSVRFIGVVVFGLIAVAFLQDSRMNAWSADAIVYLSLASMLLIIAPVYLLQVGIALIPPITTRVILALGPVLVFLMQTLEGRVTYSSYSLLCIVMYSTFAVLSNLIRNWKRTPASP